MSRKLRDALRLISLMIVVLVTPACGDADATANPYTLAVSADHGLVTIEPNLTEYPAGTKVVITATPADGHAFSFWEGDLKGAENPATLVLDGDKSISAQFVAYSDRSYYVDFAAGSDANDGVTESTPWQHAPGDPAATGTPSATVLQPGDTVLFKGGVSYRGNIKVPISGAEGRPITYRGDAWPAGVKATIDGGEPITGWAPCPSAEECGGSAEFSRLWYADVAPLDPLGLNLHEYDNGSGEDEFLWPSQAPNPDDFYFFDNHTNYFPINPASDLDPDPTLGTLTRTSITDAAVFNQAIPDYWTGSYLLVWANPNTIVTRQILSYSPADHTVTFQDLGANALYADGRNQFYALFNSPHAIDQPGEYAAIVRPDGMVRILLWPRSDVDLDQRVTRSVRKWGFDINWRNNVTIEGFTVIKHAGDGLRDGVGIGTISSASVTNYNVVVRNNRILHNRKGGGGGYGGVYLSKTVNALVANNEIVDNPSNAGIFFSSGANVRAYGNTIHRSGATSIRLYSVSRGIVDRNTITASNGGHANGVTIYLGSENILVANNSILDSNSPITFQDSGNLWFINNLVDACERTFNANEWPDTSSGAKKRGVIAFFNNTLVRNSKNSSLAMGRYPELNRYYSYNNIIDGGGSVPKHDYNLYTGLAWNQAPLEINERVETDMAVIFRNPGADYRLAPGSPAIGSGRNLAFEMPRSVFPEFDFTRDLAGRPRTGWDLGAYECDSCEAAVAVK